MEIGSGSGRVQLTPVTNVFDQEGYHYKFNGKELQPELGLNWHDYHARNYDAALGRWMNVDPMADQAPGWSPYRYRFNNPVRYIDPDGNFELDPEIAKNKPELVKYLKGLVNEWKSKSNKFKTAFYDKSGLNESQVIDMLTYGSGPMLTVQNLDKDTNGDGMEDDQVNGGTVVIIDRVTGKDKNFNNGKGKIILDDDVVDSYVSATNHLAKKAGHILLESTLFHEGVHFGRTKTAKSRSIKGESGVSLEAGKEFEKQVYGQDIGRANAKSYVLRQQQLNTIKSIGVKRTSIININSKIPQKK